VLITLDSRDYRNAYKAASASYKTALASLNRLKGLYKEQLATRSQLDNAMAQMENFQASMDNSALNLARCTVRATISGRVNMLYVEKGQLLNNFSKAAEILQIDRVKVKVGIPESDVNEVRMVTDFDVKIEALDGKIFKATKYFLSNTTDPGARLYNLDLVVENPDLEILPDMFVRVEIVKKENQGRIVVPLYSVITVNGENIVYVEKEGVAHSRKVKLGIQAGWQVEITEGLEEGENAVVVGQRDLSDGQKLRVVKMVTDPEELKR